MEKRGWEYQYQNKIFSGVEILPILNHFMKSQRSYEKFIFESFDFNEETREICLKYSFDETEKFEEKFILPEGKLNLANKEVLNSALFALHLACGVSYFKAYVPQNIEVRSGELSEEQSQFWNKLYGIGLGQFYYENKIDFRKLVNFPCIKKEFTPKEISLPNRSLLSIGGGKDSLVSLKLLEDNGFDFDNFTLGENEIFKSIDKISKYKRLVVKRIIDKNLVALSKSGKVYNGHVPVSSIIAFIEVIVCILYGYKNIIVSNESSSNEGNVSYLGMNINHQYSKSFEFEKDFDFYIKNYISKEINYFSLLRPLTELAITKNFASIATEYFSVFSSCNNNFKIQRDGTKSLWCCTCPKCAFVFLMLSAFLPKTKLIEIFGENLYEKQSLLPLFEELWGTKGSKPFECVGTSKEALAATLLASRSKEYSHSFVMDYFESKIVSTIEDADRLIEKEIGSRSEHNIPEEFYGKIKEIQ